ncbi:MAG: type II toxin-antitoxin system PemK/MazF family toxin [Actinobacteria bacterium]|nr:type II toxin-antitoxin system PemK/MazF family toxin [Actinomycetota bacterium]
MRRGEVWQYQGISRSRPVLVVSCDELNDAKQPIVVDVTSFSPQGAAALLTVRIGDELGGYARCRTISFADSTRFTELLGSAEEPAMEQVDMALRAALSL